MNVTGQSLERYRKMAVDTAEEAGRLVSEGFADPVAAAAKGADGDVVTSLDKAAEALIINRLRGAFPEHQIISEEAGAVNQNAGPWTWLVDPLDGSNNMVLGMPVAAIGLTLCYERRPVVSAVREPFVSRTWSAELGAGAWQTGERPLLRRPSGRRKPIVAWTQGYRVTSGDHRASALRSALKQYARRVLELWAPLCAWAMLARGDIDGIVGYQIGELDLHAGAVIASMTGVDIREFDGSPFDSRFRGHGEDRCLVAAVPERIADLLDLVAAQSARPESLGAAR